MDNVLDAAGKRLRRRAIGLIERFGRLVETLLRRLGFVDFRHQAGDVILLRLGCALAKRELLVFDFDGELDPVMRIALRIRKPELVFEFARNGFETLRGVIRIAPTGRMTGPRTTMLLAFGALGEALSRLAGRDRFDDRTMREERALRLLELVLNGREPAEARRGLFRQGGADARRGTKKRVDRMQKTLHQALQVLRLGDGVGHGANNGIPVELQFGDRIPQRLKRDEQLAAGDRGGLVDLFGDLCGLFGKAVIEFAHAGGFVAEHLHAERALANAVEQFGAGVLAEQLLRKVEALVAGELANLLLDGVDEFSGASRAIGDAQEALVDFFDFLLQVAGVALVLLELLERVLKRGARLIGPKSGSSADDLGSDYLRRREARCP